MSTKSVRSRNLLSKRRCRACTLEVIKEEKELESEKPIPQETSADAVNKFGKSFTPFRSSWKNSSTNGNLHAESTSRVNLKQQLESLRKNYDELLERTRKQEMENQVLQKKIEQMEADYEFMVDRQYKQFKIREEELVEQIEEYVSRNNMNRKESEVDNSESPITDTFEYEEISEKLKSLEVENNLLQKSQHSMKTENVKLKKEFSELKKSYSNLELKYIKLSQNQPKWLNMRLGSNISTGEEIKMQNCIEGTKRNKTNSQKSQVNDKNIDFEFEKLIEEKFDIKELLEDEEVKKIFKLLIAIKLKYSANLNQYETSSQMKKSLCNKEGNPESDYFHSIIELLLEFPEGIRRGYKIGHSNEANESHIDSQNNDRNKCNLSDSEKLNKSSIFLEEESNILHNNNAYKTEFSKDKIISEKETDENSNRENDSLSILEQNKHLVKEIERLQKENDSIKFECGKLCNMIQEKDSHMFKIEQEQRDIDKHRECLILYKNYIQSFIDNQRSHFEELTELLLKKNIEFQNNEEDIQHRKRDISPSENFPSAMESEMKHNKMFNDIIHEIKSTMRNLKDENKYFKNMFTKIETELREFRRISSKCKNICYSLMLQQFNAVKENISETRIISTTMRDFSDKNPLNQTLQQNVSVHSSHELRKTNEVKEKGESPDETFQSRQEDSKKQNIKSEQLVTEVKNLEVENLGAHSQNTENIIAKLHNNDINSERQQEKITEYERSNLTCNKTSYTNRIKNIATPESKKENRWKISRTREHDIRRNIDMNKLCTESSS